MRAAGVRAGLAALTLGLAAAACGRYGPPVRTSELPRPAEQAPREDAQKKPTPPAAPVPSEEAPR